MIQDIAPHVFNNHYENKEPQKDSWVLIVRDGQILCRYDDNVKDLFFPCYGEFVESGNAVYLFSIDQDDYFMLENVSVIPEGYAYYAINSFLRERVSANYKSLAAFTAMHLEKW